MLFWVGVDSIVQLYNIHVSCHININTLSQKKKKQMAPVAPYPLMKSPGVPEKLRHNPDGKTCTTIGCAKFFQTAESPLPPVVVLRALCDGKVQAVTFWSGDLHKECKQCMAYLPTCREGSGWGFSCSPGAGFGHASHTPFLSPTLH